MPRKQTLEVKLYLSELMYDVQQKAWHTGESMRGGDAASEEQASKVEELSDAGKDLVLRAFGNAYGVLRTELGEYIVEECAMADNLLLPEVRKKIVQGIVIGYAGAPSRSVSDETEDNTLVMLLRVPMNFNLGVRQGVAAAMHAYMVDCAMAEWLMVSAAAGGAAQWLERAKADLLALRVALNKRIRPTRVHEPARTEPKTKDDVRYE